MASEFEVILAKKGAKWEERIREIFAQISREKADLETELVIVRNEVSSYVLYLLSKTFIQNDMKV